MLSSDDERAKRAFIYRRLPMDGLARGEERAVADHVIATFDDLGAMVTSRLVPTKALFEHHYEAIIRC
jgi:hypothetical protein